MSRAYQLMFEAFEKEPTTATRSKNMHLFEKVNSDDLTDALEAQREVLEYTPEALEEWRAQAEQRLSPSIRRELLERRQANDVEFARKQAQAEAQYPEKIEKRMAKLKQEQRARLAQQRSKS